MSLLRPKMVVSSAYVMTGRLYKSHTGYVLLSVPNALVRGIFDTLEGPGLELPPAMGGRDLNAHITVMRPEEIDAEKVSERGHTFRYTLGGLREITPAGWRDFSKAWIIEVKSPELQNLRKSYGLSRLPKDNQHQFHITVAVRRKNVLRPNDVAKSAALFWPLFSPRSRDGAAVK